jgi:protoporphyrinogen oxidase
MAKFIENKGNNIVKNSKLTKITLENDMITQIVFNNKIIVEKIDTLVSSIPLPSLIESFENLVPKNVQEAANNLKYRDLIVVGFMLDKEKATDDSWIYFPEDKHIFVRVSEPSKYGSEMCPPGKK